MADLHYNREPSELDSLKIDQCVVINRTFVKHISGLEDLKRKKRMPTRSLEAYNACNSYYVYLEDVDAHERVTNLFPPVTFSAESINIEERELYPYSERGTQLSYLNQRPVSFIILGKPGIGTKELGRQLADYWKCAYIHPETLIQEEIDSGSRTGQCIEFNLRCGRAISVDVILKLVEKRIKSKTATHRGYVICGFPLVANDLYEEDPVSSESAVFNVQEIFEDIFAQTIELGAPPESQLKVQVSKTSAFVEEEPPGEEPPAAPAEEAPPPSEPALVEIIKEPVDVGSTTDAILVKPEIGLNYEEQINVLFSLMEQPFVTIYVACPNGDVTNKRKNYRFNMATGEVLNLQKEQSQDFFYTMYTRDSRISSEVPEDLADVFPGDQEIDEHHLENLVLVPRDFVACVAAQLEHYRYGALQPMEKQILMNDPGYFMKIDGRVSPGRMLNSVKLKLQTLPLQKVILPEKFNLRQEILGGEGVNKEEDIDVEHLTHEEFFEQFKRKEIVNKMFKYTMSDWGSKCPVSMKEGTYLNGHPKYAVHYMNKIFFLSDEEAQKKFMKNPRPYLVLPYPKPSCRIAVIGPKYSGKTSVAKCLSFLLDAELLCPYALKEKFLWEKKKEIIDKVRSEAITECMANLEVEYKNNAKEREKVRLERVKAWKAKILELLEDYLSTHAEYNESLKDSEEVSSFPLKVGHSQIKLQSLMQHLQMLNKRFRDYNLDFADDLEICRQMKENPAKLEPYMPDDLKPGPSEYVPPNVYDPVIVEYADRACRAINFMGIKLTSADLLTMYQAAIQEAEDRNEAKGNPRGGWVLDGLRPDPELIQALNPNIFDDVFILVDESENHTFLINRMREKGSNEFQEFRELFLELENVNAAYRVPTYSTESIKRRFCMTIVDDIIDRMVKHDRYNEEELPGEIDEEFIERKDEEEYFAKNPRLSAIFDFRSETTQFYQNVDEAEELFRDNNVKVNNLIINDVSLKDLLLQIIRYYEGRYSQTATPFTPEDKLQELEDFGEPAAAPAGGEEGEGEEKAIQEDTFFARRRFGDTANYCPVAFHDHFVLWRGKDEFTVKYEDKLYLLHNEEAMEEFMKRPKNFLPQFKPPDVVPPPRICVVGVSGCGKTLVSKALARNLGLYYIDFEALVMKEARQVLQFKEYAQFATRLEDLDIEEVRNYLSNGNPLPDELYEVLFPLWRQEPKRTVGFVLDGFPRRACDIEYMIKNYLIPDIILELSAAIEIVHERLLNNKITEWKQQIDRDRSIKYQNYKFEVERWERERAEMFKELMDQKRQERYAAKIGDTRGGGDLGELPVVEEGKETDEEEGQIPIKTQISFQSLADDEDIIAVNKYLDSVLPEPPAFVEDAEDEVQFRERVIADLEDTYARDLTFYKLVREYADGEQIQWIPINANAPIDSVFSQAMRYADKIKFRSNSVFERCYDIPLNDAERLLEQGYFFLSPFGRHCPVQYLEKQNPIQLYLPLSEQNKLFPLIYRHHIYFLAGKKNRDKFKEDPLLYINDPEPLRPSYIPFRVSVIGPPMCGKTTLAMRISRDFGLKYISVGRAVRYVLQYLPNSILAEQCDGVLRKGWELTAEMAIKCVEAMSMDGRSYALGCVFDGFPNIRQGIYYLAANGILPHVVIDLQASHDDIMMMRRDPIGKKYIPWVSEKLVDHRYEEWLLSQDDFRGFLGKEYQTIKKLSVYPSIWGVWTHSIGVITDVLNDIREYYKWVQYDCCLKLTSMLVNPMEFIERQGEYKQYCPACMHHENKLRSGGDPPNRDGLIQFKKFYYWVCRTHMEEFLDNTEQYLSPYNAHPLPDDLPGGLSAEELERLRNGDISNLYENGNCVVCYEDNKPDRVVNEGSFDFCTKYKGRIYLFDCAECLTKFCEDPEKYCNVVISSMKESAPYPSLEPKTLPILGFLEQQEADIIVKAVNNCANFRPLLPGLDQSISAAICIGLYLKCNNEKTKPDMMPYYKEAQNKMHERHLKLIDHLTKFKEYINPYLYYEEILPDFDEPDWMFPFVPPIEEGGDVAEGGKTPGMEFIIDEILNNINFDQLEPLPMEFQTGEMDFQPIDFNPMEVQPEGGEEYQGF